MGGIPDKGEALQGARVRLLNKQWRIWGTIGIGLPLFQRGFQTSVWLSNKEFSIAD